MNNLKALSLAALALLGGAAFAAELTIKSITCTETEDYTGADNNELRVYIDGASKPTKFNTRLNDGQTWNLNRTFTYNKTIKVELWDLDSADADDLLGTLMVGLSTPMGTGLSQRFTRDADYTIRYDLKGAIGAKTPIQSAFDSLEAWQKSTTAGKFTKVSKERLLTEVAARVKEPWLMDQSATPLCGPMAILMAMAWRDPVRYVDMARTMYETGKYTSLGKTVKPDSHLFTASVPAKSPHVDWMLSASMRDSENSIFDFDEGDLVAGITTPREMEAWMTWLLGCDKVDHNSTYLYGEKRELRIARDAVMAGNVAAILVDSQYMPGRPKGTFNVQDHWILLLDVQSMGDQVRFRVMSWGRIMEVNLNTDRFEDLFMGVVIGYGPGSKSGR